MTDHRTGAIVSNKFYGLDVVRGFATCMVALAHVAYRTGEAHLGGDKAFGGVLDGLFICVDFFFVLSGFLMGWVHWKDMGQPGQLGRYIRRRVSRIYPVYWIVLTLFLIGQFIQPSTARPLEFTFKLISTSYFVIPNDGPTLLGVAWTLYFEIIGYIAFALLICFGRIGGALLVAWAATIIVVNAVSAPSEFPLAFYLHPYHLQFLMGIAAAAFLRNRQLPFPKAIAVAGGLLFLLMVPLRIDLITDNNQLVMRLALGVFANMVIVGLIQAERTEGFAIPVSLQKFGAASYSIYLVHTIVQSPTIKYGAPYFTKVPSEIWIFPVAAISIIVGYVFHLIVEIPVTDAVKRFVLKEGDNRPSAIAGSGRP